MRCPKCGKFSRVHEREIDGRSVIFSECSDCGEIRLPREYIESRSGVKKEDDSNRFLDIQNVEFDYVKIVLGIFVIGLIGSTSFLYVQLNTKDQRVSSLSRSLLNLQTSYTTLEENYIVLLNRSTSLEEYYLELQESYLILRQEYSALERNLSNLTSERARLQEDYFEVLAEMNAIKQELDEIRSFSKVVILDNQSTVLFPESNVTFTYDIEYGGYFEINFNSSEDIFFWIGCSIVDNIFYSRYPHYPETVFNGTFVVPVSPNAYVYIGNPNEEHNATISFSIKYVY